MRRAVIISILVAASCGNAPSGPPDMTRVFACPRSLDSYCASNACVRTLAAAETESAWCPNPTTVVPIIIVTECPAYLLVNEGATTGMVTYVYARSSGMLVAVLALDMADAPDRCVAGPATIVASLSALCGGTGGTSHGICQANPHPSPGTP